MPICSITTKSASPPIGASGSKTFDSCIINCFACSSTSARFESASFTLFASSFAFSKRAVFSAPLAAPTDLDNTFCSARNVSNLSSAARRISSIAKTLSTIVTSSPRPFWDARTASGFSRRYLMSIIYLPFLVGMSQGIGCLRRLLEGFLLPPSQVHLQCDPQRQ